MDLMKLAKRIVLTLNSLLFAQISVSQDTSSFKVELDTGLHLSAGFFSMSSISSDYVITHNPSREDTVVCEKLGKLVSAQPSKKNYSNYYSLACSLWELGRLNEAEKMFLTIVTSTKPFYEVTYHHSSDTPGDRSINKYKYGSYTSNYKNYACRYLTKIYLEEKKFDKALAFIQSADKKYIVRHNCGTGHFWYRGELDRLYALAYEGLNMHDSVINMFLPNYGSHSGGVLVRSLKIVYTQSEVNENLIAAENSVVFVLDTFQTSTYTILNYGETNETRVENKYTSGTATVTLFGKEVYLEKPHLENGEVATKELFVRQFRESGFYKTLRGNE
jgi:hypothetical protein